MAVTTGDFVGPHCNIDLTFPSSSKFRQSSIATPDDIDSLKKHFSLERYENMEEIELLHGGEWRRTHLYNLRRVDRASFKKKLPDRYQHWLKIHWDALAVLEIYFTESGLVEKDEDVRELLLLVWAFLPTDWSARGMSYDCQVEHMKWFMNTTKLKDRLAIDSMLDSLLKKLCQKNEMAQAKELQRRLQLFCEVDGQPLIQTTRMVKTEGLQALLKRLLLQTPLLFWLGIFLPNIIDQELIDQLQKQSCLCTVSDGIIEVECKNTHPDRGAEVLVLWKMTIEQEEVSNAAVKACVRAADLTCT